MVGVAAEVILKELSDRALSEDQLLALASRSAPLLDPRVQRGFFSHPAVTFFSALDLARPLAELYEDTALSPLVLRQLEASLARPLHPSLHLVWSYPVRSVLSCLRPLASALPPSPRELFTVLLSDAVAAGTLPVPFTRFRTWAEELAVAACYATR